MKNWGLWLFALGIPCILILAGLGILSPQAAGYWLLGIIIAVIFFMAANSS